MNLNNDEVLIFQNILKQYRSDSGIGNFDVVEAINLAIAQRHAEIKKLESVKNKVEGKV